MIILFIIIVGLCVGFVLNRHDETVISSAFKRMKENSYDDFSDYGR